MGDNFDLKDVLTEKYNSTFYDNGEAKLVKTAMHERLEKAAKESNGRTKKNC